MDAVYRRAPQKQTRRWNTCTTKEAEKQGLKPCTPAARLGLQPRRVRRAIAVNLNGLWRHPRRPLAAILLLGTALRLWLLSHDIPTLNSDEATVGLMALHVLRGQWSVFYWGQQYMGSLEAILSAPWIALLGPTSLALHLTPMLFGLASIAAMYALAARLFSPQVGLATAALLALGPPFFIVLGMRALGGYPETLFIGTLAVLLALRGPRPGLRGLWEAAMLGLLAGLGLWTDPLVLPYLLAACAILWWQRRTDLWGRNGVALAVGLALGAAPAIVYNIMHRGVTITTILGFTLLGARSHPSAAHAGLPLSLVQEALVSLPILAGGFLAGEHVNGVSMAEFWWSANTHPVAYALDLLLVAISSGLLATLAIPVAWRWRCLRARRADRGIAVLLLVLIAYAGAFALCSEPGIATAPRYLFPLYTGVPLLVGAAARLLKRVRTARGPLLARTVALGALAVLLAWNLAGTLSLTTADTAARDHDVWITGSDDALLRLLHAHHVATVISNDYWEGLRLSYASGESIIAVMVTPEGHPGFNRYQPYVAHGLADPRPAYLELAGTPEAHLDAVRLASGTLPDYTAIAVGPFIVLVPA
jgi:4-amino-4-deoxy-L-arabinose transferase-like glycosyltransferase